MSKENKKIKDNYKRYKILVDNIKTILTSPIDVRKIKPHFRQSKLGHSTVTHSKVKDELKLEIEVNVTNNKDFKFKLFCNPVFKCPIFRFDAMGPAHKNSDISLRLKDQQITTPHFHRFNTLGFEQAYKTEALSDPKQALKLEDINLCVMHYCEEGKLWYNMNEYPTILLNSGELNLGINNDDPLKNITF